MVVRRKYKDGGRVPVEPSPETLANADVPSPAPATPTEDQDIAILRAAQATRHAEQLQREAAEAQRHQVRPADFESRISDLPERARDWLRQHPEMINDGELNDQLGAAHGYLVKKRKLGQFSREYFDALDEEFGFKTSAPPRPATPASAPERRSMPMTAPVSREVPTASGERYSSSKITLSAEEREIAQMSYKHLPAGAERDLAYARAKIEMLKLKAAGAIQGDNG